MRRLRILLLAITAVFLVSCVRQTPVAVPAVGTPVFTALHRTVLSARGKDYVFMGTYSVDSHGGVRLSASSEMGGKIFEAVRPAGATQGTVLFNATRLRNRWLVDGALADAERIHFANSPSLGEYDFRYDGLHRVISLTQWGAAHPLSQVEFSDWKEIPGATEEQPSVAVVSNRQFDYGLTVQVLAINHAKQHAEAPIP